MDVHKHRGHAAVVAVIGGGASGTLLTIDLLRRAAAARVPLRVALIDRYGRHGLGQAYSSGHPGHLLNSPADRMSAVAHDPDHLVRWAAASGIETDGFLPRPVFGSYLGELLADAEREARPDATVSRVTSDVVALTFRGLYRPLRLHLAADGRIDADVAVLATGNQPPAAPGPVPDSPRYIADPWRPGALDGVADGRQVVVLGTGLTMLDVAITLTGRHPGTVVHAISRRGLLPREHRSPSGNGTPPSIPPSPLGGPVRLPGLIRRVRAAADGAADWQATVDALRPLVPDLWRSLTIEDQRLFLRHVARYWEVHRHRVPPATARRVGRLRAQRRLSVQAGRVTAVSETAAGLRIQIEPGEPGAGPDELPAGWLINATGPAADITRTPDPLLRGLLDDGLAAPDPLRLGFQAGPGGALLDASGRPSRHLFVLGPPLRGQLYETTAIPEIRDQAAVLAAAVLAACGRRAAPDSAA